MVGTARFIGVVGAAFALVLTGCSEMSPSADPPSSTRPVAPETAAAATAGPGAPVTEPDSPATAVPKSPVTPMIAAPPSPDVPQPAPATTVVSLIAVDAAGQPSDGFTLTSPDPVGTLNCDGSYPSRSANTAGIYHCGASADAADVCWASPDNLRLLCATDPWQRTLRVYSADPPLTGIGRTESPEPWALELADGRQCRIRVGGAWGGRADGMVGAYSCTGGGDVVLQAANARTAIDTSSSTWQVAVGPLGSGSPDFPPPAIVAVHTAYLAAAAS
ncbi:hypothetical protein ACFVVM_25900 [Nocardia sp. NPDC058176]|uniref:hypothetical protein n=1 Tax=Nocardia sp. NPDC058176 TaxID=3346368 RepID=UPI0036DC017B